MKKSENSYRTQKLETQLGSKKEEYKRWTTSPGITALGAPPAHQLGSPSSMPGPMQMKRPTIVDNP
jgi:hypothetical protein